MGAALAKIGKKILVTLMGDKKGRKALGYTICITLFLVLLPLIATVGLFGWMSDTVTENLIDDKIINEYIPVEYKDELESIEKVFAEKGICDEEISKAKTIYISCLAEKKNEDEFLNAYADCFLSAENDSDLLSKISSVFNIKFTEEDIEQFQSLYGKQEE